MSEPGGAAAPGGGDDVRIGELSERTGVSTRMLRYYEQRGLITPERDPNGYRRYTDDTVELVESLRCLHDLGLDLATAADVARMGCGLEAPHGSAERLRVRELVDAQLAEVAARRAELDRTEAQLFALCDQLEEPDLTTSPPAGSRPR
jgi:DNA-binding transcriptional MerR regulator